MAQGSRPHRVAEEIRQEIGRLLLNAVRDPGIGFVTVTRVKVSPDLQVARIYYTQMGDEAARRETRHALARALPFLRGALGRRVRLRRVPELVFHFDESVENQERIERILLDLETERQAHGGQPETGDEAADPESSDSPVTTSAPAPRTDD